MSYVPSQVGWRLGASALALLILTLYLTGLDAPLSNYDEPVYAEFIRSTQSGEAGLSYRGVFTWQRPPTSIWLYSLVSALVPGEFGLRLLPALLTALTALFAGATVWRHFQSPAAGLATALFCAALPSQLLYGRMLLSDPPFVLLCVAATACTMAAQSQPRWLFWAVLCLGGTFAIKSMAGALPTLALAPWIAVAGLRHRQHPDLRAIRSVVAFAALGGAFYAIGLAAGGREFYDEHIRFILLDRAEGEVTGIGIGGPSAYLRHIWYADGPVAALLLGGGVASSALLAWRRRDWKLATASASALTLLALLSLLGTRLAHYLLPFYPLASVACGGALAHLLQAFAKRSTPLERWTGPVAVGLTLLLLSSSLGKESFDSGAQPSQPARELGQAARDQTGGPIYAFEWYAPALTYYSDRNWHFLTRSAHAARQVHSSREFREAGVAVVLSLIHI